MICEFCNTPTVTWRGPLSDLRYTQCSSCGNQNCQVQEYDQMQDGWLQEELNHSDRTYTVNIDEFWDELRKRRCATNPYTEAKAVVMVRLSDIEEVFEVIDGRG